MKNEKGMTLVEVMLAAAISLFLALGFVTYIVSSYQNLMQQKAVVARNRIATSLTRIAGMTAALRYSKYKHPENQRLQECVETFCETSGCKNMCVGDFSSAADLRLYAPFIQVLSPTSIMSSGALTGFESSGQAVYYNFDGRACDPADGTPCSPDSYPFMATTQFQGACAPLWDAFWNNNRTPAGDPTIASTWPLTADVFPQGLIAPTPCWYFSEIEITLKIKPTPGQTGSSLLGQQVNFPELVKKIALPTYRARASF